MKWTMITFSWLLATTSLSWSADGSDGKAWSGFRGDGTGITTAKNLPTSWSQTENITWKVSTAGYGQSSPVVWGEKIFLTSVEGSQRETGYMLCHDLKTGKELWRYKFAPTHKMEWSDLISRAAPTPVVDANGVYAFFEGGNLFGFSHDGKVLWERSLAKETGDFKNEFSLGSSLAQSHDAVYVLIDDKGPSYLLAVNKKDGSTIWKTNRKSRQAWSSPILTQQAGKPIVLISADGTVAAYDCKDGAVLWEKGDFSGNGVPSATAAGDLVVVGASKGRGGAQERKPVDPAKVLENCCLRLNGKEPEVVWKAKNATCGFASPLIYRDCVYFANTQGVIFCLDLKTGTEHYAQRIESSCWASPIANGDNIYLFGKDGMTTIIKAGTKFEKVASNRLIPKTEAPAGKGGPPRKQAASVESRDAGKTQSAPAFAMMQNEQDKRDRDMKRKMEGKPPEKSGQDGKSDKKGAPRRGGGGRMGSIDPAIYGVAPLDGAFIIRTGKELFCVGKPGN